MSRFSDYAELPWQRQITVKDQSSSNDLEMASCSFDALYQRQEERNKGRCPNTGIEICENVETNEQQMEDDWENKLRYKLQSSGKHHNNNRRDNIKQLPKHRSQFERCEHVETKMTNDYPYLKKQKQQPNWPVGHLVKHEFPKALDEDEKYEFIHEEMMNEFAHNAAADYHELPKTKTKTKLSSRKSGSGKRQTTSEQGQSDFNNKMDEFHKRQIPTSRDTDGINQHGLLLTTEQLQEADIIAQPFNYTGSIRQRRNCLQRNYSHCGNSDNNFNALEMTSTSHHPFYTMHNAKKVAKQLGLLVREETDISEDNCRKLQKSHIYKGRKRKCWSKFCWSTERHSHSWCENILEESNLRNHLGHRYLDYNTLKKRIEHKHYEIKEHTSDFLNAIKAPFAFWSSDIKRIEGRYGTGVLSFFVFLRWMVYVNLLMTALILLFIILPEIIFHLKEQNLFNSPTSIFHGETKTDSGCRNQYCDTEFTTESNYTTKSSAELLLFCSDNYTSGIEKKTAIVDQIQDFLQGTGWMEMTPMFIGWYKPTAVRNGFVPNYDIPIAYMLVTISYFLLCLILMVFYTRRSIRESVLKRESHLQQYCNMIFSGWDFSIEDRNLAEIKHGNILQNLRSHLAEARRLADISQWSTKKRIKITFIRILINVFVIIILGLSGIGIYESILLAEQVQGTTGPVALFTEYLPSMIITALNLFLPLLFNFLAKYEQYSLSFTVKITLIRCIFSQLASICILIGTLHSLIMCDIKTECGNGIGDCKAPMCWETYVGQQIYKLTLLDFAIAILLTFFVEYPRKVVTDKCECRLAQFIGKEEFDIPKNVLCLVYSQSLCWLGSFYSPFLPLLSLIKYICFFYLKKFSLFVNCVPTKESYKASRSNTFFMIVSMLSYLIGLFAFVYSIAIIMPSKGCGPFRMYDSAWATVVTFISKLPPQLVSVLQFIGSAGFGIPAFIILSLLLYYYLTISATYGEMTEVLKDHLIVEGRDKHFLLKKLMIILRQPEL